MAGTGREDPGSVVRRYRPRHAVALFDATYWLSTPRFDPDIGFFVAWVALDEGPARRVRRVHPRIVYKDLSLVWRVATHVVRSDGENWIGKGDVRWDVHADGEYLASAEETANLPYEVQAALDDVRGDAPRPRRDELAVDLVVRRAPADRLQPYADFTAPRRRAAARYRVNGGERVARFERPGDPRSLRFAPGYEPDFARGVLEERHSVSKVYAGDVTKFRVLSANREIQYQFVATPSHVWINPPQALTVELSTYGVRTVDVLADEELFVPGFEYHFLDTSCDPPVWHSQIPHGFAGEENSVEPHRADASAWIEELPVVRRFRAEVLGGR